VERLVLVGCGPLDARDADVVWATRLARLGEEARAEAESLAARAELGDGAALARLAVVLRAADDVEADVARAPAGIDAEAYRRVWPELDAMRRSGALLEEVARVRCPVVVLHGDADPHPVDAVVRPLRSVLGDVEVVVLERCGHTPWVERGARDAFFRALDDVTP
jgi:pimeloyl-ACP methyl ester carboxylesterase